MRAVVVSAPGTAELVEAACRPPGPGEVRIRVAVAGICGTDRRLAARGADPPRIPGHEAAGHLDDGTPVGIHPDVGCGRCPHCLAGLENRCPDKRSVGLDRDGGLAEWLCVPAAHAVPVAGLDLRLVPLLEPLACCLHALSTLAVRRGEAALVVGAGSMGLLCMWALQAAGATVAVAQRSPERRALAARLGADVFLDPGQDRRPSWAGRRRSPSSPPPAPSRWPGRWPRWPSAAGCTPSRARRAGRRWTPTSSTTGI